MSGFLSGLFETKTTDTAPKNAVARAVGGVQGGLYAGVTPASQQWDIDQSVKQSYERVIWVFRCVDAIASNSSGVQMVVREYNDVEGKIVEDDDLTKLFNRRPNFYETAQMFRYRVASQLLLSRRGVFVEVVRNNKGRAKELHILPNSSVTPVPDPLTYVSGYWVQTVTQGRVFLSPDRVLWIRVKPHPTDVYAQMTPLVAAGLASDTDFLARLYNKNFLQRDGRPGMLVAVKGQLGIEDAEEIRRRFSGGPSTAGQTTVIEADGLDVQDMSSTPRDVQWQEAVRGSKEDILLAFGVPESVLGNASGRTFDNADAEFEIFWSVTMMPFMDAMAAGYDPLTIGGMDDNYLVAHDYDQVDVLQRKKRRDQDKAKEDVKAGLMSIDEYLEFIGRQKYDVPGTRVLWIPQGVVPIGRNDEDTKAASELALVGTPPAPEEQQQLDQAQADPYGAIGQRNVWDQQSARAWNLAGKQHDPFARAAKAAQPEIGGVPAGYHRVIEFKSEKDPYAGPRARYEATIEAALDSWSERQLRTILERLGGTKARKDTRFWEGGEGYIATKAVDIMYVTEPDRWADMIADQIGDTVYEIMEKEALRAARELSKAGLMDVLTQDGLANPSGRSALDKLIGGRGANRRLALAGVTDTITDMIRQAALNQSKRIGDLIAQREEEGASIEDIKREVRSLVQGRSSWKQSLAVAATTAGMEGARDAVYEKAAKYGTKTWRTMLDERVRPAHRKAHGQTRAVRKPYTVGGHPMMYPGDMSAPIELWANCFPAGTRVWADDVVGVYRSWYEGDIITLTTATGRVITGTPNHPILTPNGWVPMGLLNDGSDLVRTLIGDGVGEGSLWVDPDVQDQPPSIDKVFDALGEFGAAIRLGQASVDFHGDLPASDVDVVLADRELRIALDPALLQHFDELSLVGADPACDAGVIDRLGTLGKRLVTHGGPTSSDIGGNGVGSSLLLGHARHAEDVGFAPTTPGHTGSCQSPVDRPTVGPVGLGDGQFALASHVATDYIVNVDVTSFSGHVYNLQTTSGMYAAQGIIVHNCRCFSQFKVNGKAVSDAMGEAMEGVA